MLIKSTVAKYEEITREVKLPFYSKYANTYYRINEDESVLSVYADGTSQRYVSMDLCVKGMLNRVGDALKGEEIAEKEFVEILQRAVNRMDTILSSLSKTEAI
jgi:hypothetical protein